MAKGNLAVLSAGIFLLIGVLGAVAQSADEVPETAMKPETAFISREAYVNTFFGFRFPIPEGTKFSVWNPPSSESLHALFGLQSQREGLLLERDMPRVTFFGIIAERLRESSPDEVTKLLRSSHLQHVQEVEIRGRTFWVGDTTQGHFFNKLDVRKYATLCSGYLLEFWLASSDVEMTKDLERSIRATTFFAPDEARLLTGAEYQPYNSRTVATTAPNPSLLRAAKEIAELDPGIQSDGTYTNATLGFAYKPPPGWHLVEKASQETLVKGGHQMMFGSDPHAAAEHVVTQQCTRILSWAAKNPYGGQQEGSNPFEIAMALHPACTHGEHLAHVVSDAGARRQFSQDMLQAFADGPLHDLELKVGTFSLGKQLMLDVSGKIALTMPGHETPETVYVSLVTTELNKYWVEVMLVAGSQPELDEIRESIQMKFSLVEAR